MRRSARNQDRPKQVTPLELRDQCLDFLQRKFYEGHPITFAKDRRRLLEWVVLWPAKWLDDRGVTITTDRYREIFMRVFMDALAFGTTKITYLPAYLAKTIQSHFDHHGDEYYEEAKSVRALTENALAITGKLAQVAPPDPVRDLAAAARLLKPKKVPQQSPVKDQLTLL